ncbi:MAG: hypothetical protein RML72_10500 [Bacteroidia bacterium]|nr:hypothetical protein [Bacteroidia bacterium]MDW8159288.1 hypothetical protein [Bacteroidia bacterium]
MKNQNPPNLREEELQKEIAQAEASIFQEFNTIKESLSIEKIINEFKKIIPQWLYRPVFLGVVVGLLSISLILRILFPNKQRIIIQNPYPYPLPPRNEKESYVPIGSNEPYPQLQPSRSSFLVELLKTSIETLILHFLKAKLIQFLEKYSSPVSKKENLGA